MAGIGHSAPSHHKESHTDTSQIFGRPTPLAPACAWARAPVAPHDPRRRPKAWRPRGACKHESPSPILGAPVSSLYQQTPRWPPVTAAGGESHHCCHEGGIELPPLPALRGRADQATSRRRNNAPARLLHGSSPAPPKAVAGEAVGSRMAPCDTSPQAFLTASGGLPSERCGSRSAYLIYLFPTSLGDRWPPQAPTLITCRFCRKRGALTCMGRRSHQCPIPWDPSLHGRPTQADAIPEHIARPAASAAASRRAPRRAR